MLGYLPVIYLCVGVSTGDIFVCWGYLLVIYLCVGVSTGDIFVCWGIYR